MCKQWKVKKLQSILKNLISFRLQSKEYTKLRTAVEQCKLKCQCLKNCNTSCNSFKAKVDCDNITCPAENCDNKFVAINNKFFNIKISKEKGYGLFTNKKIIK